MYIHGMYFDFKKGLQVIYCSIHDSTLVDQGVQSSGLSTGDSSNGRRLLQETGDVKWIDEDMVESWCVQASDGFWKSSE